MPWIYLCHRNYFVDLCYVLEISTSFSAWFSVFSHRARPALEKRAKFEACVCIWSNLRWFHLHSLDKASHKLHELVPKIWKVNEGWRHCQPVSFGTPLKKLLLQRTPYIPRWGSNISTGNTMQPQVYTLHQIISIYFYASGMKKVDPAWFKYR